jgi:acyl-CoA thioester hydrolase
MHDGLIDDLFNPRFVYFSPVHLDELTAHGYLDRAGFAPHVDSAIAAWQMNMENKAEQCFGVRDISVERLTPVVSPGVVRIDVWVERLDASSCVFGFLCSSEDGNTAYARGERTITKLDPKSHRPANWSQPFRTKHESLQKELPAYA